MQTEFFLQENTCGMYWALKEVVVLYRIWEIKSTALQLPSACILCFVCRNRLLFLPNSKANQRQFSSGSSMSDQQHVMDLDSWLHRLLAKTSTALTFQAKQKHGSRNRVLLLCSFCALKQCSFLDAFFGGFWWTLLHTLTMSKTIPGIHS